MALQSLINHGLFADGRYQIGSQQPWEQLLGPELPYVWAFCGGLHEKTTAAPVIQTLLAVAPPPFPWTEGPENSPVGNFEYFACQFPSGTVSVPFFERESYGAVSAPAFGAFVRDLPGLKALMSGMSAQALAQWMAASQQSAPYDGPVSALLMGALSSDSDILDYLVNDLKVTVSQDSTYGFTEYLAPIFRNWSSCLNGQPYGQASLPDSVLGALCSTANYGQIVADLAKVLPPELFYDLPASSGTTSLLQALAAQGTPMDATLDLSLGDATEAGGGRGSLDHAVLVSSFYGTDSTNTKLVFDSGAAVSLLKYVAQQYPSVSINSVMRTGGSTSDLMAATPLEMLLVIADDMHAKLDLAQTGAGLQSVITEVESISGFDRTVKAASGKTAYDLCNQLVQDGFAMGSSCGGLSPSPGIAAP